MGKKRTVSAHLTNMNIGELPEKKLSDFFLKKGRQIRYRKGEIIMRPDDVPPGIYYLEKGYIRTYSITIEGNEKLHIIYKSGEIFPLAWALHDEQKKLYYEAMNEVILRKVRKKDFLEFLYSDHDSVLALLQRLVITFSIFSDRIDDLEISKTYPRIIACLLFFVCQYGIPVDPEKSKTSDPYIIKAPITHRDIANFSAMTRETTSREISILEKKEIISYKNHLIVINNIRRLQRELLNYRSKEML